MNAKDCRTVRREIDTSELGQRLSQPVEMHVATCAACAKFRTERAELRDLVGSLKPVAAPADFDMRLRARIARDRDVQARRPFIFRVVLTTPAIAFAALLVIAVASIVWISQRSRTTNQPTASLSQKNENATVPNSSSTVPVTGVQAKEPVVATGTSPRKQKPLNESPRNVAKTITGTPPVPRVSDFSTTSAQSFRQTADRAGEVSLTAPSKPMVVSVKDANGATHKILLPPISFGAQRLDNRTPVSMTNRKDW